MLTHNSGITNGGSKRNEASTFNTALQSLVHPKRRQILYVLQDDPIVTVEDLARNRAAMEHDQSADDLFSDTGNRIRLKLRQHHQPHTTGAT